MLDRKLGAVLACSLLAACSVGETRSLGGKERQTKARALRMA